MAIEYFIYTDIEAVELRKMADGVAGKYKDLYEDWWVRDDLGPFHEEIMEEYGVDRPFKSSMGSRHSKARSVEAREKLLAFFDALPGRKLVLNGDSLVDYQKA